MSVWRGSRTLGHCGTLFSSAGTIPFGSRRYRRTRCVLFVPSHQVPKQKARTSRQCTIHVQVQPECVLEHPLCVSQFLYFVDSLRMSYPTGPLVKCSTSMVYPPSRTHHFALLVAYVTDAPTTLTWSQVPRPGDASCMPASVDYVMLRGNTYLGRGFFLSHPADELTHKL